MKKALLVWLYVLALPMIGHFQLDNPKGNAICSVSLPIMRVFTLGDTELNGFTSSAFGNQIRIIDPKFGLESLTAISAQLSVLYEYHSPIVIRENYSVGFNLSLGVGTQGNILNAENLKGVIFSAPQYIYYRHQFNNKVYEFMLGVKAVLGPVSSRATVIRIDSIKDGKRTLGLFFTPYRHRKYFRLSNGERVPAFKLFEVGLTYSLTG